MKTWLVKDARARFGDVIDGALAGEPQRVARRGRDAVIVVAEREWQRNRSTVPAKPLSQLVDEFPLTAEEWEEVRPVRAPHRSAIDFGE